MSKEDVEAGKKYAEKNWRTWTTSQKLNFLRLHSPNEELRQRLNVAYEEAKTAAMQQMLVEAEWKDRFLHPHLDATKKVGKGKEWNADEEKEARRLIAEKKVTTGKGLSTTLSIGYPRALALFRFIKNRPKKKHQIG